MIALTMAFSGCGSKSLSGIYVLESLSEGYVHGNISWFEVFSDGKYTSDHPNYKGEYSIDGNRIWLESYLVEDLTYYFRIKGGKLELSYDQDFEYPYVLVKQ